MSVDLLVSARSYTFLDGFLGKLRFRERSKFATLFVHRRTIPLRVYSKVVDVAPFDLIHEFCEIDGAVFFFLLFPSSKNEQNWFYRQDLWIYGVQWPKIFSILLREGRIYERDLGNSSHIVATCSLYTQEP